MPFARRDSKRSFDLASKRSVTSAFRAKPSRSGAASQWDNKLRPALQTIRKKMDHDISDSLILDSEEEEEWDEA